MLLWWMSEAQAACQVIQRSTPAGAEIQIAAQGSPDGCRRIRLVASAGVDVRAWWYTAAGSRYPLPRDHHALLAGGVHLLVVPELVSGGQVLIRVEPEGRAEGRTEPPEPLKLTVALADIPLPQESALIRRERRLELHLDPAHPGWGFADPAKGWTEVTDRWALLPDAAPERFALPLEAEVLELAGGEAAPGFVLSGADAVQARWRLPGASPQGVLEVPPGSLELIGPDLVWAFTAPAGATKTEIPGGVRWELPTGGQLRYRVLEAGGMPVIPDVQTWIAGISERFRVRSLPEPAVPTWLRADPDPSYVWESLYALCRDMVLLDPPGADPLQPRPLNRVWKGGWAGSVEKGLILQRLYGQERFPSAWLLTGADPDLTTLTGFDALLLQTPDGLLDPACRACAPGEVRVGLMGRPAVYQDAGTGTVPRLPGRLSRSIQLREDRFEVTVEASGEAALWLREAIWGADPPQQAVRLLGMLGLSGGEIRLVEGLDQRGEPIRLEVSTKEPPAPIWPDGAPWEAGAAAPG